jgi:hypothetical protein
MSAKRSVLFVAVASLAAGCGSTKIVTHTKTVSVTHTVTNTKTITLAAKPKPAPKSSRNPRRRRPQRTATQLGRFCAYRSGKAKRFKPVKRARRCR